MSHSYLEFWISGPHSNLEFRIFGPHYYLEFKINGPHYYLAYLGHILSFPDKNDEMKDEDKIDKTWRC